MIRVTFSLHFPTLVLSSSGSKGQSRVTPLSSIAPLVLESCYAVFLPICSLIEILLFVNHFLQ